MSEVKLTKDADALICALYKEYLQARKNGTSKLDAKIFGGARHIHETIVPRWSLDDVVETCRELSRARMLDCNYADNTVVMAALRDSAIIYMENRFSNGLSELLDHIEKIKSILLW